MSALPEATGNARWLSSQCPRCIADGSARRTSGSAGRLASSRLGDSQRRVSLGRGRSAAPASLHPGGQFRPTSLGRTRTCHGPSPVSMAPSHHRVEAEATTVAVQHENEHSAHRRCLHSTANSRERAAGLAHRGQPPGRCRGPSRKAVARACSRSAIPVARLMVRPQYHSYPSGMSVPVGISNGSTPFNSSAE
jgi:hypothetical protein